MQLSSLLQAQNPDGGWGYQRGSSWTEPTAFALLALRVSAYRGPAFERGWKWLVERQRPDGGWAPRPSVDQSTWVTALPVLLGADQTQWPGLERASAWLLSVSGRETSWVERLRTLMNSGRDVARGEGWPWFPQTAAWVAPTSLTLLAMARLQRRRPQAKIAERVAAGRAFLLSHACGDGGWHHGGSRAFGYESDSYPETTGLALLALAGGGPVPPKCLAAARRHWAQCHTVEGLSWLRLGFAANGLDVPAAAPGGYPPRHLLDHALSVLAQAGPEVFLK